MAAAAAFSTNEVLELILCQLTVKDIVICTGVCRAWKELIGSSHSLKLATFRKCQSADLLIFDEAYMVRNEPGKGDLRATLMRGHLYPKHFKSTIKVNPYFAQRPYGGGQPRPLSPHIMSFLEFAPTCKASRKRWDQVYAFVSKRVTAIYAQLQAGVGTCSFMAFIHAIETRKLLQAAMESAITREMFICDPPCVCMCLRILPSTQWISEPLSAATIRDPKGITIGHMFGVFLEMMKTISNRDLDGNSTLRAGFMMAD